MDIAYFLTAQHDTLDAANSQLGQNEIGVAPNPPPFIEPDTVQRSTTANADSQLQRHLAAQRNQSLSSDEPDSAGPLTPPIIPDPCGIIRQRSRSDATESILRTGARGSAFVRYEDVSFDSIARERSRSPKDKIEYRKRSPPQNVIADSERPSDEEIAASDHQSANQSGLPYWDTENTYRDGNSSVDGTAELSIERDGGLAVESVARTSGAAGTLDPASRKLGLGVESNERGGDSLGGQHHPVSAVLDPSGAIIREACNPFTSRKPGGAPARRPASSAAAPTQPGSSGQTNAPPRQTTPSTGQGYQAGRTQQQAGQGGQHPAARTTSSTHQNQSQMRDDPPPSERSRDARRRGAIQLGPSRAVHQNYRTTPVELMPQARLSRSRSPPPTAANTLNAGNAPPAQLSNTPGMPSRGQGYTNPQELGIDRGSDGTGTSGSSGAQRSKKDKERARKN